MSKLKKEKEENDDGPVAQPVVVDLRSKSRGPRRAPQREVCGFESDDGEAESAVIKKYGLRKVSREQRAAMAQKPQIDRKAALREEAARKEKAATEEAK